MQKEESSYISFVTLSFYGRCVFRSFARPLLFSSVIVVNSAEQIVKAGTSSLTHRRMGLTKWQRESNTNFDWLPGLSYIATTNEMAMCIII